MTTGFHYRPEGRGLLLAWNDPDETPGFKTNFDRAFIEKILTRGVEPPARAWRRPKSTPSGPGPGLYEMTPDHHPVIGPVEATPRLLPGQRLQRPRRDALAGHRPHCGRPDPRGHSDLVDTELLGVERFASGRLLHETAVL